MSATPAFPQKVFSSASCENSPSRLRSPDYSIDLACRKLDFSPELLLLSVLCALYSLHRCLSIALSSSLEGRRLVANEHNHVISERGSFWKLPSYSGTIYPVYQHLCQET